MALAADHLTRHSAGHAPALDVQQACELIFDIEQRYDVNQYYFDQIHLWPIVRHMLWWELIASAPPGPSRSVKQLLRKQAARAASPIWNGAVKRSVQSLPETDVLFLSPGAYYSETVCGLRYSRIIDPVYEGVRERTSAQKMSLDTGRIHKLHPSRNFPLQAPPPSSFAINDDIQDLLQQVTAKKSLDFISMMRKLSRTLNILKKFHSFFDLVLSQVKPRAIVLTCYYDLRHMGLIWAAKDRNVRTIDLQHGKQGCFQAMYSHWSRIPPLGYAVLPSEFWNWGRQSAEHIMCWRRDPNIHKAIPFGFPWIGKWRSLNAEKDKPKPGSWPQRKKVVLVTLQGELGGNDVLPEFLLKAMDRLQDSHFWLIRPHFNAPESERIARDKTNGVDNHVCSIDEGKNHSLYQLLTWSDFHLTSFSSVCYEASEFGVPTGIWSEVGGSLYSGEIRGGHFYEVRDVDALSSFLTSSPYVNRPTSYFESPVNTDLLGSL